MPGTRSHRGAHPEDQRDFAPAAWPALRAAVYELSFLLGRDYASEAALKLVGDRHQLTARQRLAVMRASCSEQSLQMRTARRVAVAELASRAVAVDGFNCLISVEAMLSCAPLLRGRDGALRDLASVHGTYRAVQETERAAELIVKTLGRYRPASVEIVFDRPISNSGRTRALFAERAAALDCPAQVRLSERVDQELVLSDAVIASSDSWILERARAWLDLPAAIAQDERLELWLIDLQP
jgi:hypothetical protein